MEKGVAEVAFRPQRVVLVDLLMLMVVGEVVPQREMAAHQ
jgi:hypothetical protein